MRNALQTAQTHENRPGGAKHLPETEEAEFDPQAWEARVQEKIRAWTYVFTATGDTYGWRHELYLAGFRHVDRDIWTTKAGERTPLDPSITRIRNLPGLKLKMARF